MLKIKPDKRFNIFLRPPEAFQGIKITLFRNGAGKSKAVDLRIFGSNKSSAVGLKIQVSKTGVIPFHTIGDSSPFQLNKRKAIKLHEKKTISIRFIQKAPKKK